MYIYIYVHICILTVVIIIITIIIIVTLWFKTAFVFPSASTSWGAAPRLPRRRGVSEKETQPGPGL